MGRAEISSTEREVACRRFLLAARVAAIASSLATVAGVGFVVVRHQPVFPVITFAILTFTFFTLGRTSPVYGDHLVRIRRTGLLLWAVAALLIGVTLSLAAYTAIRR
jgi:hypothetical protein